MPATPPQELAAESGCYACLGMGLGDALFLALWDRISQNIAPPSETFYLLSDVGDILISQAGDRLVYQ